MSSDIKEAALIGQPPLRFIGNFFSYKAKMLRRDATRVELKMHLRAHTGAQRVTK